MISFTYNRAHNPRALISEILSAIPELAPTLGEDGLMYATFTLESSGTEITIRVPDDFPEATVAAVVAAHTNPADPTLADFGNDAESLTDTARVAQAVANLRAYLALGSPTAAQSAAALKLLIRVVLAMLKRLV